MMMSLMIHDFVFEVCFTCFSKRGSWNGSNVLQRTHSRNENRRFQTSPSGSATASTLHCLSPRVAAATTLALRISANAQQYSPLPSPSHNLTFAFYPTPLVARTEPAGGPLVGGTRLTLHGSGLDFPPTADGVGLHCKLGQRVVPAHNGTCLLPSDDEMGVGRELTDDGLRLHGAAKRDATSYHGLGRRRGLARRPCAAEVAGHCLLCSSDGVWAARRRSLARRIARSPGTATARLAVPVLALCTSAVQRGCRYWNEDALSLPRREMRCHCASLS